MGSVGAHGTVLQKRDLAIYNVTIRGDAACNKQCALEDARLGSARASCSQAQHLRCRTTTLRPCGRYTSEAPCDADNVTFGGCVWCDIVDRPAFCTTKTYARHEMPPPPQMPPHHCTGMDPPRPRHLEA